MKSLAITLAAIVAATAADAATTISSIGDGQFSTYVGRADVVTEDFESSPIAELAPGGALTTNVGVFTTLGGTGTGSTVTGISPNAGKNLFVREGNLPSSTVFGRYNTTPGGARFLDSNDTLGFRWEISFANLLFKSLAFTLTDAADQGATVTISTPGATTVTLTSSGSNNARRRNYLISFDDYIADAVVEIRASKVNDGMGIDDVSAQVAPVPLPAAAPLMIGGLAALGLLGRRRRRAA